MDYGNIDLKWQNMLKGIKAQADFVRYSPPKIYQSIKEKVQLGRLPERIFLSGCGDSWYCGMATRFAFEAWTGIPTEGIQALEFSRYLVNYAPENSLLLAVSNSGRVSRTLESVVQAKKRGMYTIAATTNFKEGISQEADCVIELGYSEMSFAPGTSSYMASLMVQYCLALYLAELAGKFDEEQVQAKLDQISALGDPIEQSIEENLPILEALAKETKLSDKVIFIGGGPNYGTAFFSMAKMIESTRTGAVGQELEEWAHEQYFVTDENTLTFVITPPGAGTSRAREQMYAIKEMGSKCVAICSIDDQETGSDADIVAPIIGDFDELLSPIVYCVPGEIFAFQVAVENDLKMLGFDNPKVKEVNFKQIFGSEVER